MATTTTETRETRERVLARRLARAKAAPAAAAEQTDAARAKDDEKVRALVTQFWAGADVDARGNPQSRVQAVTCARQLLDRGIGARKAASLLGRAPNDNGAQRYFEVAAGLRDDLIKSREIADSPISRLAALVRERRHEAQGKTAPNQSRADRARRAYGRLRAFVERESEEWNVADLLKVFARTGRWPAADAVEVVPMRRRQRKAA